MSGSLRQVALLLTAVVLAAPTEASAQRGCQPTDIVVTPSQVTVTVGGTARVVASAYDSTGHQCQLGTGSLAWASTNVNVARVESGIVTGIAAGTAVLRVQLATEGSVRIGLAAVLVSDVRPAAATPPPGAAAPVPSVPSTPGGRGEARAPTADWSIEPFRGGTPNELLEYSRRMVLRLDSAVVALVEVFRNTPGAPLAGATGPHVMSSRERGRWARCRALYFDLGTFAVAAAGVRDIPAQADAGIRQAMSALAAADLGAIAECDNIGSMIDAPDRWAPWQFSYEASARAFYSGWYPQLRALHEACREVARALNAALPSERAVVVPPRLPLVAPHIGGQVTAAGGAKTAPAASRDMDGDGVPDVRDRCRGTDAGTPVDERGCPSEGPQPADTERPAADSGMPPPPQAIAAIRAGETRVGVLEQGDWTMGDGTWADLWTVSLAAGDEVFIELRSRAFDAYLQLLGPEGSKLAEDDDGLGNGNSRIRLVAKAGGRYQIVVNNFGGEPAVGAYSLTVR